MGSPDLIGSAALAFSDGLPGNGPAEEVCSPVVNIADVAGKICVINRGGCTFQSKHDRCLAAGGIGTIVVNRDNGVITMNVRDIEPQEVLIMIGRDSGDLITVALNMGKTVTLQVGRGTGPRAPLPEYSSPDPFGVVNVFTGKRDLLVSPFILADDIGVDWQRKLMYVFDVDGAIPEVNLVLNYTTTVDGAFPVVGSFIRVKRYICWNLLDGLVRYTFMILPGIKQQIQNYCQIYPHQHATVQTQALEELKFTQVVNTFTWLIPMTPNVEHL